MAPIQNRSTAASSKLNPATEAAVNDLWKHQLRKENAALLEKTEARGNKLQEEVDSLKAELTRVSSETARYRQECEKNRMEIASLRSEMEAIIEGINKRVELYSHGFPSELEMMKADLAEQRTRIDELSQESLDLDSSSGIITKPFSKTRQPDESTPINETNPPFENPKHLSTTRTTNEIQHPANTRPIQSVSPIFYHPTRNNRLRNTRRSAARSSQSTSQVSQDSSPQVKLPNLAQGINITLEDYLIKASTMFKSLPKSAETPFIALFIKGLRNNIIRKRLESELLSKYNSGARRDGKMDILCEWANVGEAMRRLGLMRDEMQPPPAKRRKRMLISKEAMGLL